MYSVWHRGTSSALLPYSITFCLLCYQMPECILFSALCTLFSKLLSVDFPDESQRQIMYYSLLTLNCFHIK